MSMNYPNYVDGEVIDTRPSTGGRKIPPICPFRTTGGIGKEKGGEGGSEGGRCVDKLIFALLSDSDSSSD